MRVRRADGSHVERSVAQLSGGEWRRVGLALSLAFADFARARLGLSCNVLVLDEVMQHMDVDGQARAVHMQCRCTCAYSARAVRMQCTRSTWTSTAKQ